MTRGRQRRPAPAPPPALRPVLLPVILLVGCYLLLEVVPALAGATRSRLLTRPPVLEPVRLASLLLLEVVLPLVVAGGLLVLLRRTAGRPGLRLRVLAVPAGAVASAELLKWLLPADRSGTGRLLVPGNGSFPSGHTAVAVALALLLTAVRPPPGATPPGPAPVGRAPVGPAVAWSVLVAGATVTAQWHRPSDALGGALLAVVWYRLLLPPGPHGARHRGGLLGWWTAATALVVPAVAVSWWSVPAPMHRVLPHLLATVLLAVAVGAVIPAAATAPAERSG